MNGSTNINNTIFCPSQYGQYNISVAANNSAGVGNVTTEIVDIPKCKDIKAVCMFIVVALNRYSLNTHNEYNKYRWRMEYYNIFGIPAVSWL